MYERGTKKDQIKNFPYDKPYQYPCKNCATKCDDKSKLFYDFIEDTAFAAKVEDMKMEYIKTKPNVIECYKPGKKTPYPDIMVTYRDEYNTHNLIIGTESKGQTRTFMSSMNCLCDHNGIVLCPSETIALNKSDLVEYFNVYKKEKLNMMIWWALFNRPCIVKPGKVKIFKQNIRILKELYDLDVNNGRVHKRNEGEGDIVNGIHKGVIVNYHFRLSELIEDKEFGERDIPQYILDLRRK